MDEDGANLHQDITPGSKRPHGLLHGGRLAPAPTANYGNKKAWPQKRPRPSLLSGTTQSAAPRYLVVHRVQCPRKAVLGHARHHDSALYLDSPRLFKDDNRASNLRGTEPIQSSLEEYLDAHSDINLVVIRDYDCSDHHDLMHNSFRRLPLPQADAEMGVELRPYFDVLDQNTAPAEISSETIDISPHLREAMKRLETLEPALFNKWEATLIPPYLGVYHTRKRMRQLASGQDSAGQVLDKDQAIQLSLLLDYVESSFGDEYAEADSLFSRGLVSRAHLDKLWLPNDVIVTVDDGETACYVIASFPSPSRASAVPVILECYNWQFDGVFRREWTTIYVEWPEEEEDVELIAIKSLNVWPLRFDRAATGGPGKTETALRSRGEMFWSCRKRKLVGYTAPMLSFEIQVSNPRYMIDIATYRELHEKDQAPNTTAGGAAGAKKDELGEKEMEQNQPPDDPFLLLLPPRILGFGLHDKKWRSLIVRHLREANWNKRAIEQLVLDPRKKELIKAMVMIHISSNMSTDVIEGKGNGLIILLHGGPGTGKTLTAESVAELAEKPLYRVTCGDIGTDPESVERYLESVLYIGRIWKAVVLLDESDVFLEEREKSDIARNSLVSAFLRVLEYYEGILILTSNRVGIFDEAFKSRIQLALHYPALDVKGRREIWINLINLLRRQQEPEGSEQAGTVSMKNGSAGSRGGETGLLADGEKVNVDELLDKVDVLARESLNGRQIRNALTTARQLARFRGQALGYEHLQQTIQIANDFEEYVEKTQGVKAAEFARSAGLRFE